MLLLRVKFLLGEVTLLLGPVVKVLDGLAVDGELLGVGELLKDGLALLLGSREECVELPLRQHGHAAKLLERQSDGVQERLASLGLHFRPRPSIDGVVPLGRSVLDVTAARGLVGVAQLQAQR